MHTHFVWYGEVKACCGDTAEANYGLTGLFYAQTIAIYRFYTYDLVIDDAPTIVYGCIGHSKIWGYCVSTL